MKALWIIASYLHVLGVATYLGGAVVMEFVLGPAQRAIPPAQAQVMGERASRRFLVLAWTALAVIPISGVLRLVALRNAELLVSGRLLTTPYGRTMLAMVVLWVVLVVNGAVITFVLRPRLASRMTAGVSAEDVNRSRQSAIRAATWTSRIARADLVILVVVALLGTSLRPGGLA